MEAHEKESCNAITACLSEQIGALADGMSQSDRKERGQAYQKVIDHFGRCLQLNLYPTARAHIMARIKATRQIPGLEGIGQVYIDTIKRFNSEHVAAVKMSMGLVKPIEPPTTQFLAGNRYKTRGGGVVEIISDNYPEPWPIVGSQDGETHRWLESGRLNTTMECNGDLMPGALPLDSPA